MYNLETKAYGIKATRSSLVIEKLYISPETDDNIPESLSKVKKR